MRVGNRRYMHDMHSGWLSGYQNLHRERGDSCELQGRLAGWLLSWYISSIVHTCVRLMSATSFHLG
jgi:hypothetical protein